MTRRNLQIVVLAGVIGWIIGSAAIGINLHAGGDPLTPRQVITRADIGPATTVSLPMPPYPANGDFNYGYGLAVFQTAAGEWHAYTSSWAPQYILEYRLPVSLAGSATFVRNLGALEQQGMLLGIYFDQATNRVCGSAGNTYDTDPSTQPTLFCAEIDPATNKFRTTTNAAGQVVTARRFWVFSDATQPCRAVPAPLATDVTADAMTFAAPHGLTTGRMVTVATTGGGLSQTAYYYARNRAAAVLSLHPTVGDAQNNTKPVDLTAPITAALTSCVPRGDRRTMGGLHHVPADLVDLLHGDTVVGFGGYQSVITSGDQSSGPTACGFTLPAQTFAGTIPCTPLVGFKWRQSECAGFANRDANYANTIAWDACAQKGTDNAAVYGTGKWASGDTISQGGFLISKPTAWMFGTIADVNQGCVWYGDNGANRFPVLREGPATAPTLTNVATGVVTFPDTINWSTGQMVQLSASQNGLIGGGFAVYFVRDAVNIPHGYTFYRNQAEALGAPGPTPFVTDVVRNRVTFADPHGFSTGMAVMVSTTGAGLTAGTVYYVNAAYPTVLTFHLTAADSAGANLGNSDAKAIDLTGPMTAAVIAQSKLTLTGPITTPVRMMSYCAKSGGAKASLNSQGSRHVLYAFNPADLAAVAAGQHVENQQPVDVANLDMPGILYGTYGASGMPATGRRLQGAMWVDGLDRLAVEIQDTTATKQGRRIHFFPVKPKQLYVVTATRLETAEQQGDVEVMASSPDEAVELAKVKGFTFHTVATTQTEPTYVAVVKPPAQ